MAEGFSTKQNLLHCAGAIDEMHIALRCPRNGDHCTLTTNFQSIVFLAFVHADYEVLYGTNGAGYDEGVLGETDLTDAFEEDGPGLQTAHQDSFGDFTDDRQQLTAFLPRCMYATRYWRS